MSKLFPLLCVVILLSLTGCYRSNVVYNPHAALGAPTVAAYSHHLIAGIVNAGGPMYVERMCPEGVARVQTKNNGVSFIASLFTGYIYMPVRVRVWCNPEDSSTESISHEVREPLPAPNQPAPTVESQDSGLAP